MCHIVKYLLFFSKFIPEGSLRIESSCVSGLECVAVQRPDNGIVVVVLNR